MTPLTTAKYNLQGIVRFQEQANKLAQRKKKLFYEKGRGEKLCFQCQLGIGHFVSE